MTTPQIKTLETSLNTLSTEDNTLSWEPYVQCCSDLAAAWLALSRDRKAIEYYTLAITCVEKAIAIAETAPLIEKAATLHLLLGNLYRKLGTHKLTGAHYQKAVSYQQKRCDADEDLGHTYLLVGGFLEQLWKLKLANTYYQKAKDCFKALFGPTHEHTLTAEKKLMQISKKQIKMKK